MISRDEFAHPEFLTDAVWLNQHLSDPDLAIIDIGPEAGFLRGHVPGAVFLADNYERDPELGWVNTFPPERFAATCQGLGIGDDTLVVVYDNSQSLQAARFWWVLNYYGHTRVKVLDGGWRAWASGGFPVSFDLSHYAGNHQAGQPPTPVTFTPRIEPSLKCDLAEVQAGLQRSDTIIWDTRSYPEFSGQQDRGHQRRGHIAGAVHLEWFDLMDPATHRFKSPEEIRRRLAEGGFTPDKAVFAY